MKLPLRIALYFLLSLVALPLAQAQQTKLLRQPSLSDSHIAFTYGSDVWISNLNGKNVKRITSTQAVEGNPVISPDGQTIAFYL